MFRTGLNLVAPQRQRPLLAAKPGIDPTCVAHLCTSFTPPPYRRLPRKTVTTFWSRVFLVRYLRRVVVVYVRVDEFLGAQLVSLLEVQAACVAEGPLRRGFAAPQRRGRNMTVETGFFRGPLVGVAAAASGR